MARAVFFLKVVENVHPDKADIDVVVKVKWGWGGEKNKHWFFLEKKVFIITMTGIS